MTGGNIVRRTWNSIPRETLWGAWLAACFYYGQEGSAVTLLFCAAAYETVRWLVERDTERIRRGLSERYGVEFR